MSGYLLDTHILLWMVAKTKRFKGLSRLEAETSPLYISLVSCFEIAMLASQNKLHLGMPCREWFFRALEKSGIRLLNIDLETVLGAYELPGTLHGDPADRLLVSAARLNDLTLVTYDRKIRSYAKAGYVRVLDA